MIEKKIEKKINTIIQITGEYPKQIEVTQEEYEQLGQDTFMGVKLKNKRVGGTNEIHKRRCRANAHKSLKK